jgi:hypothetical protein
MMTDVVILDPRTGKPADQTNHYRDYLREAASGDTDWLEDAFRAGRVPWSVVEHMAHAVERRRASGPTATKQGFHEVLANDIADGATVTATTTETIICPDYSFAANDPHVYPGAVFRTTCYYGVSTVVTTPGTITMRLRWGGVGGTALAATGALAPSTVATTLAGGWIEFLTTVRTIGAAGSMYTLGRQWLNNFDPTSATTLKGNLNMMAIPPNGTSPAVVSSLDTTTAKAWSVTVQFSVVTANTTIINNERILECLT